MSGSDIAAVGLLISLIIATWSPLLPMMRNLEPVDGRLLIEDRKLATYFVVSRNLSARVFGQKIVSVRSITTSFIMTGVTAIGAFSVAILLTGAQCDCDPWVSMMDRWLRFPSVFAIAFVLSATVDFASMCQTRLLLRYVSVEMNALKLVSLLLTDLLLSLAIFLITFQFLTYIVLTYIGLTHFGHVNFDISIAGLIADAKLVLDRFLEHPYSGFTGFSTWCLMFPKWPDAPGIVYPFTTFLATSFITSVWIWITAFAVFVVWMILFEKKVIQKTQEFELSPRKILYLGVGLSLLWCVLLL